MQVELHFGDHTEVAAAATQRPVQIGVLGRVRGHEGSVGQHHIGGPEVVDGQTVGTGEVADAAAEGQAGDAGGRDDAAGGGEPEGVRGMVEVAPVAAALYAGRPLLRVDADALHRAEVQDDAVVDGAEPRHAVGARADGEVESALAGGVDGDAHIGDVDGADDREGSAVDHRVVHRAGLVVDRRLCGDHLAADRFEHGQYGCAVHFRSLDGSDRVS